MKICKITVLKKMLNREIAEDYRNPSAEISTCPFFSVGQEFIVEDLGEKPESFPCGWAWNDIHKIVLSLMSGGGFGEWMKETNTYIACCTDGIKPVVFKVERL